MKFYAFQLYSFMFINYSIDRNIKIQNEQGKVIYIREKALLALTIDICQHMMKAH